MDKITLIGDLPDFTLHATIVTQIEGTKKTDGGRRYYSLDKGQTYHLFIAYEECVKRFKRIKKSELKRILESSNG